MTSFPSKDPLLCAFDTLPAHQLLTAIQLAMVLQMSPRWLEEQRGKGRPPPWVKIEPGRAVRYAAGPLRTWIQGLISTAPVSTHEASSAKENDIAGLDEPILRGGRRKKPKPEHGTFPAFFTTASLEDEWAFLLCGESRRPVDFITASLDERPMDKDDEECAWLTLDIFNGNTQCGVLRKEPERKGFF